METFKKVMKVILSVIKKIWFVIKKILEQLWLIIDNIKGFLIVLLVAFLILFLASTITHNVLRSEEISIKYTGEYKKLYPVKDGMMNIYETGSGAETVVILGGFSVSSPTLQYKALAEEIGKNYRVIIVEYPGTGFSLSTKDERTNKNIVEEVRLALKAAEISGPYILMPFDISNIYAMYYAEHYPDEVSGIISVDGLYPKAITKKTFKEEYLPNLIANVNFHSVIGYFGLYRWETYLYPEKYNIDKLEKNDAYEKTEIDLYRKLLANKFLTKEMRNELKTLEKNMKEMVDYEYPENLPVIEIIFKDTVADYLTRGENLKKHASDVISNSKLQKIKLWDNKVEHYLFEETEAIANTLKNDLYYIYIEDTDETEDIIIPEEPEDFEEEIVVPDEEEVEDEEEDVTITTDVEEEEEEEKITITTDVEEEKEYVVVLPNEDEEEEEEEKITITNTVQEDKKKVTITNKIN